MTEPTQEARKELAAINAVRAEYNYGPVSEAVAYVTMLALDRHHNRTPPDPYVAKAKRLTQVWAEHGWDAFLAQLHKEFPDG